MIIFLYLFDFLLYFPCTRYTEVAVFLILLCSGMQKAAGGPLSPAVSGHPDHLYLVVFPFPAEAGSVPFRRRRPSGALRPVRVLPGPDPAFPGGFFPSSQGAESDLTGTYNLQGLNLEVTGRLRLAYCEKKDLVVCSSQRHAIVCANQETSITYLHELNTGGIAS